MPTTPTRCPPVPDMNRQPDISVFVTVVELGGFTAAGRALGLSTSVVSRRVKALEDSLGVRLLERTTRQVRTTTVGQAYYTQVAPLLDALDAAARAARSQRTEPRGVLRIAVPAAFGRCYLAEVFASFTRRFDQVAIDASFSDRSVDLVSDPFDLAIRGGASIDEHLVARKLLDFHGVCIASPDYLSLHGRPSRPEDLEDHACLINSGLRTMPGWTFARGDETLHVAVDGPFRSDDGSALVAAAEAGMGIAYEPVFIAAQAIARGTVIPLELDARPYQGSFYAVYANRRHLPVRVRLFIDHLRAAWASPPWTVQEPG